MRETKRCREIVRGLLDFARQTPPRRQPTDLNDVARRAAAVVMNQLQLGHVALDLDLADGLPPVEADPNQMQQVVVNLLLNAADAIGERGGDDSSRPAGRRSCRRAATSPSAAPPARTDATCWIPARASAGLPAIRVLREHGAARVGVLARSDLRPLQPRLRRAVRRRGRWPPRPVPALPHEPRRARGDAASAAARRRSRCTVADDEPIRWCTRTGCHFTRWEARERRGPAPVVEIAVEDNGRGIARENLAEALRAVLHAPRACTAPGSGSRSPGASSRATAARSRSRARRAREAGSRCACRSTRAARERGAA